MRVRRLRRRVALAFVLACLAPATANAYVVHNLVSDQPGVADHTDPSLVNAWGLAALPTSPWWVNAADNDLSAIYRANGTTARPPVNVAGGPTGLVANPGTAFVVHEGDASGSARFIFATEGGQILGWNPSVAPNDAVVAADLSSEGAIFKGLAISGDRLYAADFHNARVVVFNGAFGRVSGGFSDPTLPEGYAPFGIQTIRDHVFVTYAKQDELAEDEVAGPGLGYVDEYTRTGAFVRRVASRGELNAPWGLALAPSNFGTFSGDLLVGNFGDGRINAFKRTSTGGWQRVGLLRRSNGEALYIDGLWALEFGLGSLDNNGATNTLFFTAGPDDESHGWFGTIRTG